MKKLTYLAVFEPSTDGYGVYFPDLPGCVGYGKTFDEAYSSAEDALSLHIYGMEKDGDKLPGPTANPTLDEDTAPGALVSPVSVFPDLVRNELDNRRVKTNVTIPAWLKDVAEQRDVNYSQLLETALLDYLNHPHPLSH